MIPVAQTRLYRPGDDPRGPSTGNCMAACVASIFEVPISQAEGCAPGHGQAVMDWTREHHPGLRAIVKRLRPTFEREREERLDDWQLWPLIGEVTNPGYWIAGVYSQRIPDLRITGCGCTERVPGGDPGCQWCHGQPERRQLGISWGLHAVVMREDRVVWDPHPRRADGLAPNGERGALANQVTWTVVDPARL